MNRLIAAALATTALTALPALAATRAEVLETYGDIAQAGYADSATLARALQQAVDTLITEPSPQNLQAARVPYQQAEVYRFGNPIVDGWEGKVNAWPLDEGLIDYVDASHGGAMGENEYAGLNVIANSTFTLSGQDLNGDDPGAVDALVPQTWSIERAVAALGVDRIGFAGSDSIDSPDTVFQ